MTPTPHPDRTTPQLPLSVGTALGSSDSIVNDGRRFPLAYISVGKHRTREQADAAAALIVRAVNSHDALVEALEEAAVAQAQLLAMAKHTGCGWAVKDASNLIRQALQSVRGGSDG